MICFVSLCAALLLLLNSFYDCTIYPGFQVIKFLDSEYIVTIRSLMLKDRFKYNAYLKCLDIKCRLIDTLQTLVSGNIPHNNTI
jgi:hypothetical protein